MRINAICGEIHSILFYLADILLYNNQTNSIGKFIVVQGNKLATVGIRGTFQRTLRIALQGYYIECCTKQDGLP